MAAAPKTTETPAVTATQVLDGLKAARTKITAIQEKEAKNRADFRAEQQKVKVLLEQAKTVEPLEVLAGNALTSGLVDTTDPATFQSLSEPVVRELAAREHL